ncbi:MAG: pilus assembly protein PilM [bacterium]|nr:pilus assembly protein PilM [bacterium]
MAHNVLDSFPTPKILRMESAGMDVSDGAVRFVALESRKGKSTLLKYGEKEIPENAIISGHIQKPEIVTQVLSDLAKQHNLTNVKVTMPEEKLFLFKTSIPVLSEKEIRSAVEFKLEENVPIEANKINFDFSVLAHPGRRDHEDVIVAAIPKKVVEVYESVFAGAGLFPIVFTVKSQSVSRSVVARGDKSAFLVIHVENQRTGLYVVSDELVQFTSSVSVGENQFKNLAAKKLSISLSEAEQLIDTQCYGDEKMDKRLPAVLKEAVLDFTGEINKTLIYWNTHKDNSGEQGKQIYNVIMCGKAALMKGVPELISHGIRLNVSVADVWQNAFSTSEFIPPISFFESQDFAAAIGTALPEL